MLEDPTNTDPKRLAMVHALAIEIAPMLATVARSQRREPERREPERTALPWIRFVEAAFAPRET